MRSDAPTEYVMLREIPATPSCIPLYPRCNARPLCYALIAPLELLIHIFQLSIIFTEFSFLLLSDLKIQPPTSPISS